MYSEYLGASSYVEKGVLLIPQNTSITGTSPSDCLVSYPGQLLGGRGDAVGVFYNPSRRGKIFFMAR